MKKRILAGMALAVGLLLAVAGVYRSQDMVEPPAPPDPPDPPEYFVFNDGHPRLGVSLVEVTAEKAQELKLSAPGGALVASVHKDSAAAKAGIEKDDVIVEFDGVRVRSSAELRRLIQETPADRTVAIKVMRGGQPHTLHAKLEAPAHHDYTFNISPEFKMPNVHIPEFNFNFGGGQTSLGISGDDLTSQLAQYFGVKSGKGVLVREVMAGSAAEKAGLKAGDVIVQVDRTQVGCVEELRSALNENFTDDKRQVTLAIVRDHRDQSLKVELTRSTSSEHHMAFLLDGWSPEAAQLKALAEETAEAQRRSHEMSAAQAEEMRAQAERLRKEMENQKSLIKNEWQQQLRNETRQLQEQLKSLKDLQVSQKSDSVI